MKYLIGIVSIIVLGAIFQNFFPFWTMAVAAFIVAMFVGGKARVAFGYGLIAGLLLWGGYASFIDINNEGLLAQKMGRLFGNIGRPLILLLTALIGGLLCAFGAMTGSIAFQFFNKKDNNNTVPPRPDEEEIEYKDFKNLRPEWKDQDFA